MKSILSSALAATAFVALAGLSMSSAEARPRHTDHGRQTACTREFRPVCGVKFGNRKTYPNACVARADRARVAYPGKCRGR